MAKYRVIIEETLCKIIETEADTQQEALDKIKERYNNEEIVLTADDYSHTCFAASKIIEKEND